MKKTVIILLLCFPAFAYANPVIMFESETHNFGRVAGGQLLEYSFDFTNVGTEELVIQRISPPWGCTTAVAGSSRLKPGESGSIKVRVDFGYRIGTIVKTVVVYSNDPERPKVTLTLVADNWPQAICYSEKYLIPFQLRIIGSCPKSVCNRKESLNHRWSLVRLVHRLILTFKKAKLHQQYEWKWTPLIGPDNGRFTDNPQREHLAKEIGFRNNLLDRGVHHFFDVFLHSLSVLVSDSPEVHRVHATTTQAVKHPN